MAYIDRGTPFSITTAVSGNNATATQVGTTNGIYYITDISGSSGATATGIGTLTIYANSSTGTISLWSTGISGSIPLFVSFRSPLKGNLGFSVSVTAIGNGPSYSNMSGYLISDA